MIRNALIGTLLAIIVAACEAPQTQSHMAPAQRDHALNSRVQVITLVPQSQPAAPRPAPARPAPRPIAPEEVPPEIRRLESISGLLMTFGDLNSSTAEAISQSRPQGG